MKTVQKNNLVAVALVVAWAIIALMLSQVMVGLPMTWLLGDSLQKVGWIYLYYVLYYSLTLVLIFTGPKFAKRLIIQRHEKKTHKLLQILPTNDLATLGINRWPTFIDIGLAPIGYAVYALIANLLLTVMQIFPWFDVDQNQDVGFYYFTSTNERLLAMLALVFIAPLVEEIIMRGWLYGNLRIKLQAPLAILLTSVIFAALHGQWNVGVGVFILSLVLCGLREITGTIWSGVMLHMLANGIAFYLLYNVGV